MCTVTCGLIYCGLKMKGTEKKAQMISTSKRELEIEVALKSFKINK